MPQPSNYQVQANQSQEEEFDVEQVFANPPTNLSAVEDGNDITIVPDSADDAATAENEGADATSSSIVSKFASLLVNKKTAAFAMAMLGTGAIVGASVQHKQKQQKALLASVNSGSGVSNSMPKSGESTSFCEPESVIECGAVITNQKVVLSDDLFCTGADDVNGPTDLSVLNAAIKLSGPDASIDCKGHTIHQRRVGTEFAAGCETDPGQSLTPSDARKTMKGNCKLYYQVGIWLEDGATAINCKAEQFYDGFMVRNGGKVKRSEATLNRRGFFIQGGGEISKVHAYNNNDGIRAFIPYPLGSTDAEENVVTIEDEDVINEDATIELEDVDNDDVPNMSDLSAYALDNQDGVLFDLSAATAIAEKFNVTIGDVTTLNPNNLTVLDALVNQDGIGVDANHDANATTATAASISTAANADYDSDTITIKGATSNNNFRDGMSLRGGGIFVKDSTTSYNGRVGIRVAGGKISWSWPSIFNPTFVQFEGTVSSHHNLEHGIEVGPGAGPVGEGNLYSGVNVKGVVNSYLNGVYGFYVWPSTALRMFFQKRGSWKMCQNAIEDLYLDSLVYVSMPFVGDIFPNYFTCNGARNGDKWLPNVCTPCPLCN